MIELNAKQKRWFIQDYANGKVTLEDYPLYRFAGEPPVIHWSDNGDTLTYKGEEWNVAELSAEIRKAQQIIEGIPPLITFSVRKDNNE